MQHTTHNKQQSSLIHHFLEQSARTFPDKIALVHEDIRATYFEINNKANHLAHWLLGRGITKGDRVVLLLENTIEYVISYYGALKTGAVVASLNSDLKPDGLRSIIRDLEPGIIISSRKFRKKSEGGGSEFFSSKGFNFRQTGAEMVFGFPSRSFYGRISRGERSFRPRHPNG
jgi:acyl-CoA synthetase (AMP-forming)/AMP-acid ligase II